MSSREHLAQLSREELTNIAVEQNDKLKELLAHFRQLQEENVKLKGGGDPSAGGAELRHTIHQKDSQIAELEAKIAALVAKTRELLDDYVRLQQEKEKGDKGRGGAVKDAEVEALKAENERLRKQVESAHRGATSAAADGAEVSVLRARVQELEHTVRRLRERGGAPAAVPTSPQQQPTTQQMAGMAAAVAGGGGSSKKRSLNLEGHLLKQGGGWGPFKSHFKERYFELRGAQGTLYYFNKKGGEQLGDIPLEGATVAAASIRPHAFCIFGPMMSRTYMMAALNAEDMQKWVDAISHAADHYTAFVRGTAMPSSPKKKDGANPQGHLEVVPEVGASSCIGTVVEDLEGASCVYDRVRPDAAETEPVLQDFEMLVVVGLGSFGKVLKVRHRGTKRVFAMKVLQKDNIVKNHMVPHTKAERNILESINHPFIVGLHYAFQTRKQLVFILDFLTGGELFFHLAQDVKFSEARSRFYAAEIALALSHLHSKKIIYRDLKPENLVLDGKGHVNLTDFGLAKTEVADVTHTFCGTPQYMAPELILKQGHGKAVDWWSLGVFLFEMVSGVAPFPNTGNIRQLYEQIVSHPPPFNSSGHSFSRESKEACLRLLAKDPAERIYTVEATRELAFFRPLNFDAVLRCEIPVPFKPCHKGDDTRYVDAEFKREKVEVGDVGGNKDGATIVFDDFTFVRK